MGVTVSIQPAQIRRLTNERHLSSPPGLRNLRWWPLAFNADGFAAGVMRISDAQDLAGSPLVPPGAISSAAVRRIAQSPSGAVLLESALP